MIRIWTLLLSIFLVLSQDLQTQELDFTLTPDTNNVLIGDFIGLDLRLEADSNRSFTWPAIEDTSFGGMEVIEQSDIDTVANDSAFILSQKFTVAAYDSGSYDIPEFITSYQKEGFDTPSTLSTEPLTININTVAVDTSKSIKDIKSIIDIDITDWSLYYIIGGILLGIALLIIGIMYFKKRKKKAEPKAEKLDYDPKIPPYILAIESLRKLEDERLWQAGKVKKYYTELVDILRIYYHRIYDIKTLELTSDELMQQLKGRNYFNEKAEEKLRYILQYSDLSKFAKANPLPEENRKSMEYAKELVEIGKPLSDKQEGAKNVE